VWKKIFRKGKVSKKDINLISLIEKKFDSSFYEEEYGDLTNSSLNLLQHYYFFGWKEGRNPCSWFNTEDYLSLYPDVLQSGINPFCHYVMFGKEEGRKTQNDSENNEFEYNKKIIAGEFDSEFYRNQYPNIDSNGLCPLEHFILFGWKEGRDPCAWFSTNDYIQTHLDIKNEGINPFIHFLRHGRYENRHYISSKLVDINDIDSAKQIDIQKVTDAIEKDFDSKFYLRNYGDIRDGGIDPLMHYVLYGWQEGRNPCDWFSSTFYLNRYDDVRVNNINPFYHYLTVGAQEKRQIKGVRDVSIDGKIKLFKDKNSSLVDSKDIKELLNSYTSRANKKECGHIFNKSCLDLHWVIPDFSPGAGGHMTIFRMVRWLEVFGHKCTIWILNPIRHCSGDEAYQEIIKSFQTVSANVFLIDKETFPYKGDAVIATAWQTVHVVEQVTGFKDKFYFVQDYEPNFYARGSLSLLAEATYKKQLNCICASPWLKGIIENDYQGWARSFMLAYDRSVYKIDQTKTNENKKIKIAVYSRIGTARRSVELALAALEVLAHQRDDFEVHLFGSSHQFEAAPFDCIIHGVLSPAELAELYQGCDIGICFSATNYSLVPQEMMACGLPLIELNVESTQAIFPNDIVTLAKPNPLEISHSISLLIDNHELRQCQSDRALEWVLSFSWEGSARDVESAIIEKLLENFISKEKPSSQIKVSIVIPTFNGGDFFIEKVLSAVKAQRAPWKYEIIVIDSESSDGTAQLLEEDKEVRFISIPQAEFQHGSTRNYGASISSGEYVAYLTQDALPADEYWLYNMVSVLDHYPDAAGAFGKHIPHDDASFFTRLELDNHFKEFDLLPIVVSKQLDSERYERERAWRQKLHYYSDNSSCLRRCVWEKIPYREVKYGEDQLWADDVINNNYQKVYAISSVIKHSHEYLPEQVYERSKIEADFFNYFWGYQMIDEKNSGVIIKDFIEHDTSLAKNEGLSETEILLRDKILRQRFRGYIDGQNISLSLFDKSNKEKSKF